MSRLTLGNVVKVGAVVVFLPLLAYLVLVIGGVKKKLAVILEGLLYAGAFSAAVFVLGFWGWPMLLALAATGASGVRAWHLRDLWLPARRRWWRREPASSESAAAESAQLREVIEAADGGTEPVEGSAHLPSAVAWVRAHANRNRVRLPTGAHVLVLQTCQVLDAVVAAEKIEPSGDPRFEYELDALARQYLPKVLRTYLAIAPSRVDERQANGRSANEELTEQLRLLSGQAEALYASRHRRLTAELGTTGHFLREKFGHRERSVLDLE